MKNAINWLVARLKERSTWLGIIGFASAVGVTLSPEQTTAIASAGVAIASVIATTTKD